MADQRTDISAWPFDGGTLATLIRERNWSGTPLGPVEGWPQCLRSCLDLCLASNMPMAIHWGEDLVFLCNEACAALIDEAPERVIGRPCREAFPDVWAAVGSILQDVLASGRPTEVRNRHLPPGRRGARESAYFDYALSPIRDEEGRIRGVLIIANEVSDRVRAEREQQENERRLRTLVEGIPQLVWRAGYGGEWIWSNPQWTAYTGLSEAESRKEGWLAALHPDDRTAAQAAWSRAGTSPEIMELETRIWHAAEKRYRWFQTRAAPVFDAQGGVAEWLGTSTDVNDLRELRDQEHLLFGELQHRVRNTLAVIRSIVRRSAKTSGTVEDYAMHLEGRLGAFARIQSRIIRDPGAGLDLKEIIDEEMLAHAAHEGEQYTTSGPAVRFTAKEGETMALAIHELAANAVKFGGLSTEDGRIAVDWHVEDGSTPLLALQWKESGAPNSATEGELGGFGTELLQETLPYMLKAQTAMTREADGITWLIRIPLSGKIVVEAEADS